MAFEYIRKKLIKVTKYCKIKRTGCKILKISPGPYYFSKGTSEGLIHKGANYRRNIICLSKMAKETRVFIGALMSGS